MIIAAAPGARREKAPGARPEAFIPCAPLRYLDAPESLRETKSVSPFAKGGVGVSK
jgi:hypothetical protein